MEAAAGNPAVDSDSAIRAAKRMAKLRRWHEKTVQEWAPLHGALGEWLMRRLVPAPKEKEPKQLWENRGRSFQGAHEGRHRLLQCSFLVCLRL